MIRNVRPQGERVRNYIIAHVDRYPADIARRTAQEFGISRQAVNKHLQHLVNERALTATGTTRDRRYALRVRHSEEKVYTLANRRTEDDVWREDIASVIGELPKNVLDIWQYGFTEMYNNVLDHADARHAVVNLARTATRTEMRIYDDGVGIFTKIRKELNLEDERHAVLELAKGKLTTDPRNHSGEGIFFTSRVFDRFAILSGTTYFSHDFDEADWILEQPEASQGTHVLMQLNNHTSRTTRKVFAKFTSGDEGLFDKTVVPVRLAQYGDELLVSRSQAKRLLARVDRFRTVILDFAEVRGIGQAFADEIFRVFRTGNTRIELVSINANPEVRVMIQRAMASPS